MGGAHGKAERRTAGLHGGVQHTRRTAGQDTNTNLTSPSFFYLLLTDGVPPCFCWQFVVDTGLDSELSINLSVPLSNVSFRVCAYTGAGQGPWTPTQTLTLITPGEFY